jgi:hypothetical protein
MEQYHNNKHDIPSNRLQVVGFINGRALRVVLLGRVISPGIPT